MNYVIGKVVGQAYIFGVIMSFLMQPLGIILAIIIPCLVIVILEVIKIVMVLTSGKRQKEKQAREEQEKELEALRQQIAELQKANVAEKSSDTNSEEGSSE